MVFQEFNLFPHLSVIGNCIEAPVHVKGMHKADAIKLAATHSVTIDCSVDTSAAVAALKEVAGSSDTGKSDKKTAGKTEAKPEDKTAAKGPIYWADSANEFFGKVDTEAEYKAKKAKSETVFKITESIYEKKLADLKAKNEAFAALVDPIVIDAAATLLFAAVMIWSHRSKTKPGK